MTTRDPAALLNPGSWEAYAVAPMMPEGPEANAARRAELLGLRFRGPEPALQLFLLRNATHSVGLEYVMNSPGVKRCTTDKDVVRLALESSNVCRVLDVGNGQFRIQRQVPLPELLRLVEARFASS